MTCTNCGQTIPDDAAFCSNCGFKIAPAETPVQPVAVQEPLKTQPSVPAVPFENKPLSPWAYLGYQILFSIPLVGFILLIILSTKAAHNVNLRNFARSYWCALLIGIILFAVLVIIGLILSTALGLSIGAFFNELPTGSYF